MYEEDRAIARMLERERQSEKRGEEMRRDGGECGEGEEGGERQGGTDI